MQIWRRFIISLLFGCGFLLAHQPLRAQDSCRLRVSILTCGPGDELYSCYGHSAIRLYDSCAGTDIVYNYGTFNFGDPDFYSKFIRGKLLYYLNDESFEGFMSIYLREGRSVTEQLLELSTPDKERIRAFLTNNLKEENKYYRYDFLYDNCSTRIRDIFSTLFNDRMRFGRAMYDDSCSFRDELDTYERNKHWERTGINLLLSDLVDQRMSNLESMFLPDYLMKGFADATIDRMPIVADTIQLLPQQLVIPERMNQARLFFFGLLIVVVMLTFYKQASSFLLYFDVLLFLIIGLLGCFMLFMWLGTEHAVCAWNRNLLWAFPLHVAFAFLIPRNSEMAAKYAKYASWLLIIAWIHGLIAEQKYITEITPLLILIYLRLNRYSKQGNRFFTFRKFN